MDRYQLITESFLQSNERASCRIDGEKAQIRYHPMVCLCESFKLNLQYSAKLNRGWNNSGSGTTRI